MKAHLWLRLTLAFALGLAPRALAATGEPLSCGAIYKHLNADWLLDEQWKKHIFAGELFPGKDQPFPYSIYTPNSSVEPARIEAVKDALKEIAPFLTKVDYSPPIVSTKLYFPGDGHQGSYNSLVGVISASIKTISDLKTVAQHEMGHNVFHETMARYFPEWQAYKQARAAFREQYADRIAKSDINKAISAQAAYNGTLDRTFPLQAEVIQRQSGISREWADLHAEVSQNLQPSFPPGFLSSIPYQEVFSDMLPVLATRDPKILTHLHKSAEAWESTTTAYRDFSVWGLWDALKKRKLFSGEKQRSVHLLLNPARHYLWKNYIKEMNPEKRADIVASVMKAMAFEVDRIAKAGFDPMKHPIRANFYLLRALRKELGPPRNWR